MYRVRFTKQAETDLSRLDRTVAQRVMNRIRWLAENYDEVAPETLAGPWQAYYKLRVGDYRILYTLTESDEDTLVIHFVRHRREI
jgi:mRNA interferase RelE/StbE